MADGRRGIVRTENHEKLTILRNEQTSRDKGAFSPDFRSIPIQNVNLQISHQLLKVTCLDGAVAVFSVGELLNEVSKTEFSFELLVLLSVTSTTTANKFECVNYPLRMRSVITATNGNYDAYGEFINKCQQLR
uniref:Uncharacterized protein n=1 Tax=Romanomermis culicivorax TaxID=13658 RepID=A0A915JH57_ROMCU